MGYWHKPWQVGIIINKIKQNQHPQILYEYEKMRGWTDALDEQHYWNNTKWRIKQLTGYSFLTFVPKDSIPYRFILKYYLDMEKNFKKDPKLWEHLKNVDKDDLITIIQILKESLEKERKENSGKVKRQKMSKDLSKMVENTSRSCSQRKLCAAFSYNRKTFFNNKDKPLDKKVCRTDFKHNQWFYKNEVISTFEEYHCCQGAFKIHGILMRKGIQISTPTIRRILNDAHLFVVTKPDYFTPHELKDTNHLRPYLLTEELRKTYLPGEAFSADFMYLQTSEGIKFVHGVIDVISQEVVSLEVYDHMTADAVIKSLNDLPSTAKVFNTDYGTQYFDKTVQEEFAKRKIQHSCGKPGRSTDNGWIERFWKRLRGEWLDCRKSEILAKKYNIVLIKDYQIFWNHKRLISTLNWQTPHEYGITYNGVN